MEYRNSPNNNRKANLVIGFVLVAIFMLVKAIDYLFNFGWVPDI